MSYIVAATDRKPEATTRNHPATSQREMPLVAEVAAPHLASEQFVSVASWDGSLRYAVQRSGFDDYEVADELDISHGYMSRLMRGTANLDGDRLVNLMRITRSVAPLQWLAGQMGFDLVARDSRSARIRELEQQLEAARRTA
jgi:hypothetical protein